MKITAAYCNGQHLSSMIPVMEELRRRGHDVRPLHLEHGTLQPHPNQDLAALEECDVFLCSYPHILKTSDGHTTPYAKGLKVCVEHGVNPVAWAWPLDRHDFFDAICVAGKWQKDIVEKNPMFQYLAHKCFLTGWPKVDHLVGVSAHDRQSARKALEKKMKQKFTDAPVISFVPTHSGAWWKVDELRRLGIPNLVIAPHEGRYSAFRGHESWGRKLEINYAEQYPYYIETSNIHEVLMASDLVISDYSSAMLEALVLDIPVLQILVDVELHNRDGMRPPQLGYYPLSQKDPRPFKVGPNVLDISRVPTEITMLLSNKAYYQKEREFWKNEIFSDLGDATRIVCDLIETLKR